MHTRVYHSGQPLSRPPRSAAWKRRVLAGLLVLVALYVASVSWLAPAYAVSGQQTVSLPTADRTVTPDWPDYGQAAFGAVGYGVLASHQSDQPLATASIAKIITALAVLQKRPLAADASGPTLTMTQRDVDLFQSYLHRHGSVIAVRAGQKLSQRQALEAMLLRSANNMADTLAIWTFGSLQAYQTYANRYVAELGLTDTHVGLDASGFDPTTTSTASDLVKLGEIALRQATL
ncbi:MAG TPA: serine hydrolase, partial [Candidatus Saccharimonadales bacterium]|nr:serine hydrolase [Candidatus Saccharimonadales bacterium]